MRTGDLILEVDRVASVEEALAFRDAGATLIGVALDSDPRFTDARFVSRMTAKAIQNAIFPARLVGIVPTDFEANVVETRARIERVLELGPSFVHFYRGGLPGELTSMVHRANIPIIRDGAMLDADQGVFVDPKDPASFVREQLEDRDVVRPALYHLDVLTDMAMDPWTFLNSEALEWPEETPQVEDIAATTRDLPFLLSLMGVGAETVGAYVRAFPDARGFFARLGPEISSAPSTTPAALLATLRGLQAPVPARL